MMALVHGELYTALVAAGAPPEKAEAAARAENERGRGGSRTVDARLAQLEIRVKVLSWMVGLALALIALLVLTHPNV
jgi:hypothetical protein